MNTECYNSAKAWHLSCAEDLFERVHTLSLFLLTLTLQGKFYYDFHFTEKETEVHFVNISKRKEQTQILSQILGSICVFSLLPSFVLMLHHV